MLSEKPQKMKIQLLNIEEVTFLDRKQKVKR